MGTLAGLRSFVGSDGFGRPPGRLLHVLMLPDVERVAAIGKLWAAPNRTWRGAGARGKGQLPGETRLHPVATLSTFLH
jgi:hypothetical protein